MIRTSRRPIASLVFVLAIAAVFLTREPGPGELRLGQKVLVDDGSCPSGQVKEISGARLTPSGIERTARCVSKR